LPWGEFSPLLDSPARAEAHGIASSGEVAFRLVEHRSFAVSGAQMTALENPGERPDFGRGFSHPVATARCGARKGEGIYDPKVPGTTAKKSRCRTRPVPVSLFGVRGSMYYEVEFSDLCQR
jgi:hypothetical protein